MVNFNNNALLRAIREDRPAYTGVKGSIVRIRIKNFVTYRDVEIFAGSNINLVLGPNGTGKSTVVCAICLGLGGKAKILSRAQNVKEYIRHGSTEAAVEIELFNPEGHNYIVQRVITEQEGAASGVKSTWFLQGKSVPEKKVEELMGKLNIQLDNLCQFLPQDRVQEFARMDSVSLLKCTEMAVGDDDLSQKHEELIAMNSAIKKLDYTLNGIGERLRTEIQHNNRLQSDVQTFREREELTAKMNEYRGKQLWIIYQNSLEEFNTLKVEENKVLKKKQEKERAIAPLKKAVEKLESAAGKHKDQATRLRSSITSKSAVVARSFTTSRETADHECSELMAGIEADEDQEKERIEKVRALANRIRSAESELEECAQDQAISPEVVQQEIGVLNRKRTEINRQIIEANQLDEQDTVNKNEMLRRIENSNSELRRMGDMRGARMTFLERFYPDCAKTIRFFEKEENRAKLRGKLWDPPILHVFVDDLKYGPVAEKHIRVSDLTAFYCEHKDDVYTISDLVYKELRARVSVIHHVCPPGFKKPRSAFTPEFMRKYHFEKVLIDLIQAPDYYMSYLVPSFKPECVPMGGPALDALMGKIMEETDVRSFYSEEYSYYVKTSSYSGSKFSTCTHLNAPRIFTTKINENEQNKIREAIKNAQNEIEKIEAGIRSRQAGLRKLESEKSEVDTKISSIRAKANHYSNLEKRVRMLKTQLRDLEGQKRDLVALKKKAYADCCTRRIRQLENVEASAKTMVSIVNEGLNYSISRKQNNYLEKSNVQKANQYEEAKSSFAELLNEVKGIQAQVKTAAEKSSKAKGEAVEQSNLDSPPEDVRLGQVTEESLEREISMAKVKLDFLVDINPDVIRKYQERCAKINELTNTKDTQEQEMQDLTTKLEETKAQWLGPLNDLVERIDTNFSKFFASMKCAGQISLDKGTDENDFSKYGIKIKVKFRAAEQLTELSGWKQSGGERAITTALYILALQELTTVPFRVIDEINQGMDAKNEARFFKLLCSLAEGENTPQYFLLTPKMLPEVDYPDNVEFHFIFSGPHVQLKNFRDSRGQPFSCDEDSEHESGRRRALVESSSSSEEDGSDESGSEEDEEDPEEVELSD